MYIHGNHCSRLIYYDIRFDTYYIPDYVAYPQEIGSSYNCVPKQNIAFCPWCGDSLPKGHRDAWYDELEALGLDPNVDDIPGKYLTDEWRK